MRHARGCADRRCGAALVVVVLLTLGMFALAHGLLLSSMRELAAARAGVRELEARTAAEAGARSALLVPAGRWMDSVPVHGSRTVGAFSFGRAQATGAARRLRGEAWLLEGRATVGRAGASRATVLAWSLDPLTRVRDLAGALSVSMGAGVSILGPVDVSGPAATHAPHAPADCAGWVPALEAHYREAPLGPLATFPPDSSGPALGLLDFDALLAAADVRVAGSGSPTPTERLGACMTDEPWNWGDPDRPWRACAGHLALRAAPAGLAAHDGVGQGLLFVDGDLTLSDATRFRGLVVVRGTLRLLEGSVLDGLALASGGAEVDATSRVRASGCWAVRALAAHRERLGRFRELSPGTWIGPP